MKEKCRKVTATLLCCILALLSVAAEFSHHHGLALNAESGSAFAAAKSETSGNLNTTHSYNCIACQFAAINLAVFPPLTICVVEATTAQLFVTQSENDSQFSFQFSCLRAPPAVLA